MVPRCIHQYESMLKETFLFLGEGERRPYQEGQRAGEQAFKMSAEKVTMPRHFMQIFLIWFEQTTFHIHTFPPISTTFQLPVTLPVYLYQQIICIPVCIPYPNLF